jgi:D-alanyl-D-alanine carboxypeptidase
LKLRLPSGLAFLCLFLIPVAAAATTPAYIVIDANGGRILAQHNSGRPSFPASVTKLMTAYVTFAALKTGRIKLTSPVVESPNALSEPPSKMGFPVGTVMTLDNALKMMLVHSANDIAVAIGEAVGGSEARFVGEMNAAARALGMTGTHFENPNGLPNDQHITTARDLAVLSRALWLDFPEYRPYLGIPAIKAGRRILRSQNILLDRYRGANGMKTGFTCAAGYNMVASATRDARTLIVVVLGAESSKQRAETAAKLLNDGFAGIGRSVGDLAGYRGEATGGAPVNMHDAVCKRHAPSEEDDTSLAGTSLDPPFEVMAPVVVTTGGADPGSSVVAAGADPAPVAVNSPSTTPSAAALSKAKRVPIPRLRPMSPVGKGAAADSGTVNFSQRFDPRGAGGTPPAALVQ